jgi:PAS domain-containing protein
MLVDTGPLGNALLVIATLMFLRPWQMQWGARTVALPAVMAIAGLLAISAVTFQVAGVLVDPIGGIVVTAACIAWVGLLELATRSRTLLRERSTSTMRQMMITHIVEDSSDGIVVVRDTGKVELCNEQAARLLNVPQRALTGYSVESFLPEFDATVPSGDSVEGQGRTCDIRLDGPDGGYLIEMSVRRSRFDVMDDAAGTGATRSLAGVAGQPLGRAGHDRLGARA